MRRSNLKLVPPSSTDPALGKLEAALAAAEATLAKTRVAESEAQREVHAFTPATASDPSHERYRKAYAAREHAFEVVEAAERAISDHHLAVGRAASEEDRRRVLAGAIEAAKKANAALAAVRTALGRAQEMADRVEHAITVAAAAIVKAKEGNARLAEKAARSGRPIVESDALHEARALEQKASDDLEAARAAAAKIEARIPALEDDCRRAADEVTAAIGNLLALNAAQLLERARRQQSELGATRAVLRRLRGAGLIDADRESINAFFEQPPFPFERNQFSTPPPKHPEIPAWDAAIEALACDADTPLPPASSS